MSSTASLLPASRVAKTMAKVAAAKAVTAKAVTAKARAKAAAVKVIEREAEALNNYPGGLGHAGLRKIMADRESRREGVTVDPDHLALTNGSMQAVTLAAETLQEAPGDGVIIEEFSYPGTLAAYRSLLGPQHSAGVLRSLEEAHVPVAVLDVAQAPDTRA